MNKSNKLSGGSLGFFDSPALPIVFLFFGIALLVACTANQEKAPEVAAQDSIVARIFYGTDRNQQETDKPSGYYGLRRGKLSYGLADVSITQPGEKVSLEKVTPLARETFLGQLQQAVQSAPSPIAMVFVHGYNRSFHQVSKLAAEFATATGFRGVTIIWSWPSSRNPAGYLEDEVNMRWSRPHLSQFLRDIVEQSGAETVHLLGHSMGARGLTDVMLRDLLPGGLDRAKIGEYVLLAPDIDKAIFKRDLAPQLVAAGLKTTLYTSSNDKAMASAYRLRRYPRAGDSSYGPIVSPGIETIDATSANNSILGHSYFEESDSVAADLAELLNYRKSATDRDNLVHVEEGGYWQLLVTE